jgi:outer membrane receptor protein involved in Fe transport
MADAGATKATLLANLAGSVSQVDEQFNVDSPTATDWLDYRKQFLFHRDIHQNDFSFFFKDTWKASRRLTLNYGLRVNHIGWWYDTGGHIGVFVPSAYSNTVPYSGIESHATTPSVAISGSKPLGFQWAPSVGFAYDLTGVGKTMLAVAIRLIPATSAYPEGVP